MARGTCWHTHHRAVICLEARLVDQRYIWFAINCCAAYFHHKKIIRRKNLGRFSSHQFSCKICDVHGNSLHDILPYLWLIYFNTNYRSSWHHLLRRNHFIIQNFIRQEETIYIYETSSCILHFTSASHIFLS